MCGWEEGVRGKSKIRSQVRGGAQARVPGIKEIGNRDGKKEVNGKHQKE